MSFRGRPTGRPRNPRGATPAIVPILARTVMGHSRAGGTMHIVHVFISVLPESVEAFRLATLDNARNSLRERGVARFDILEDVEQPGRFTLVEVYRTTADAARHKETAHYRRWAEAVGGMVPPPRPRSPYHNVFPADEGWG